MGFHDLQRIMSRFGLTFRGTVVPNTPDALTSVDTAESVLFTHSSCTTFFEISTHPVDDDTLDRLTYFSHTIDPDPAECSWCKAIPNGLPDHLSNHNLVPYESTDICERCDSAEANWFYLPSTPDHNQDVPCHYFCGSCLGIPDNADVESEDVKAAVVQLTLTNT
jgi:hypothetical protein